MKPIYRSRFDVFWDGIFVVFSIILLIELPMYIYGPTDEIFMENQLFLIPLIIICIVATYAFTLRFISVYPTIVVFEKPIGLSKRRIVIQKSDITQVEIEPDKRPKLIVYHHAEGTSIRLYEDEVLPIKKAFAHIDIPLG
jgi:hypothetical protein